MNELLLIGAMWKRLDTEGCVYVVVDHPEEIPFIESPDFTPQLDILSEDQIESSIIVFTSLDDAVSYREQLLGIHDEVRPSEVRVGRLAVPLLYEMLEELDVISHEDFGCPVRIELACMAGEELVTDILYSKFSMPN